METSAGRVDGRVAGTQPDSDHRNRFAHTSEPPAGDLHPADGDHDGRCTPMSADMLATLIEQLQENWDHDNNAANDELVMRIREHIRRQRTPAPGPDTSRGGEDDDMQRPSGAGVTSSPPVMGFPHRVRWEREEPTAS